MKKNVVRALVLGTVATAALAFIARGGSRKEKITTAKQESSVETEAGEATKVGESKMDETTKAGETRADASKKDDKAADAKESMIVDTLDGVKDLAFTLVDEKGTAYQFTFERGKAPEGFSDIKAGDKITVTYTGMISETNPFKGMVVPVKKA